jgi:F-type H+-transporting ATPase subunit b
MLAILNIAMMFFSEGGEGGGSLLDVNPGLIFWTVITFVILLLILKKFAWKPILNALSERENLIKDSLDKAEKARVEFERLTEENKIRIAKAEEEAQKVIAQGREYAEKIKAQVVEQSKVEAKKMIEDAVAAIERKQQESFSNLKEQVADIAINAAEKIIRENLDKEKQLKIVDKYIQDIAKN